MEKKTSTEKFKSAVDYSIKKKKKSKQRGTVLY